MTLEQEFDTQMEKLYYRAGHEADYWANYFIRDLRKHGGFATAKRLLRPRKGNTGHKGLQALIDHGMTHISVESLVLDERFQNLFTTVEIAEARRRMAEIPAHASREAVPAAENHPETLSERREYVEGAVMRVVVSIYERDQHARDACLKRHGRNCSVCGMNFEKRYGKIGKGFIHVHHKKPLAACRGTYRLNPARDLAPVCPNCHAMLHTSDPPLSIEELSGILKDRERK